jgi:NitT/TauT family transport system substrate-binding protein
MEDEARWRIENNLTDKTAVPNYLDFMYFGGLQAVKPEAITAIR